jgi:hypothetical protein
MRIVVGLPAPLRIRLRLACGKCHQAARRAERWQRRGTRRSGLLEVFAGALCRCRMSVWAGTVRGMADEPDPGGSPPSPARPKSGRRQPGGVSTPHDAVFRRIFAVPANAASQLRAVLDQPSGGEAFTVDVH